MLLRLPPAVLRAGALVGLALPLGASLAGPVAPRTAPGAAPTSPGEPLPPNVLIVLADDFGVDLVNAYGEGSAPPCTPTLDGLAANGLLFRNAWANPVCSPTRAALLTGRHGFRTGIGAVIMNGPGLSLAETTLPEALRDGPAAYATAALGKWHLSGNLGALHPNQSGFDHFAGTLTGAVPDYSAWSKTSDGSTLPATTYITVDTTDDALAAVSSLPEPWFVYVSYHAPHTPAHAPPAGLCPSAVDCPNALCGNLPANPTTPELVKAMTEVMDAELGRLVAAIDPSDTYLFFLGDNGTAAQAVELPFVPNKAKGSVFEGGVNVPLLVRGPGVAQGETAALVGVTDLFATVGELTGQALTADDSVSFASVLASPAARPRRSVYAETFSTNGSALPITDHDYALRDERYKLLVRAGTPDRLFDLLADPFETQNLLQNPTAAATAAYDRLRAEVVALHTGADLVGLPAGISVTAGGAQQLVLAPGPEHAGRVHFLVGSASGNLPGIPLDGTTLYLNYDGYLAFSVSGANGPVFGGTLGLVGEQGTAVASVTLPAGMSPSLAGALLQHAYVVLEPSGAVALASTPVALTLTP